MKDVLTEKQKRFCDYYLETGNATEAAIKAGYSKKYANTNANKLLQNTTIKPYIKQRLQQMDEERIAKPEEVLKYLTGVMRGEIKDQFDLDAPLQERTRAAEALAKRYRLYDSSFMNDYEKRKNELQLKEMELKNAKLEAETKRLTKEDNIIIDDKPFELPARLIAPSFAPVVFDIEDKKHREYVLDGGRGSTKSSFVGLQVVNLIKKNPQMHVLAVRKVADTLRDSVYAQIKWAISALELDNEFNCLKSPLEIVYKPTGQKIYFRGCDDSTKIKSIKPEFGYIGVLWFEELDQFVGAEQVRNVEQSAIRGGDDAFIFKTFNPPKTANNWANKYIKIPKENQFQLHTDFTTVPEKWLGKTFIEEAEHLKNVNPTAYEHEYLGIANGNGGNVFDNVEIREIKDEELKEFDRIYQAVDFGWFPDPWAFVRVHFDAARRILYIFDEHKENKKSNRETYDIMVNQHGITPNDKVTCDSAEPKSIEDYKSYGLFARGAIKGPGSVEYSMKWLQSLTKIVIDNKRCPESATEFLDYEYERDKEGNVISGYPDINNHFIDACRYATNDIWRRKGQ
jgi:PBSX family phage terminase large subunit